MDEMVLAAQNWLNNTYGERAGYQLVEATGQTGWSTMYALTRALQLELGITATSNNFGAGTLAALEGHGTIGPDQNDENENIVKIIQSALYCKGYGPGGITGFFGPGTESAVANMKANMGLAAADGTITPKVFKALLTMDAYVLLGSSGGTEKIRTIQQWLNNRYHHRLNFYFQPCDGIYSRGTQQALIYAIQYEEGLSDSVANGNFGPTTKANLPTLRVGSSDGTTQFVHLLQAALCFNTFEVDFDGAFGNGTRNQMIAFQSFAMLDADGVAGPQTWASLLVSTGDPERSGTALDCVTEITPARAQTLVNAGYETVGRYLTNVEGTTLNKKIQAGELQTIFDAGLTVFPIYQTYGGSASYFNSSQGAADAEAAHAAARSYGFPAGTVIYFAVDYDSTDDEITSRILPHFQAVKQTIDSFGSYRVGIYGTRNACSRVSAAGYAEFSFVSGMSTGFSGNLGFPLPDNWAFDQISTITLGSGDGAIEIDNNIKSGRDNGISEVVETGEDYDEYLIKSALTKVGAGIELFQGVAGKIELDGEERVLLDTNLLKVTFSASYEISQGTEDSNVIFVVDKHPNGSILATLSEAEDLSNEMKINSEGIINTLSSNIENGLIRTSFSISTSGEIEYTYDVTVVDIDLPFSTNASASIQYKVTIKNTNFPTENQLPVDVQDGLNNLSNQFIEGLVTAGKVIAGVVVVGLVAAGLIYGAASIAAAGTVYSSGAAAISALLVLLGL